MFEFKKDWMYERDKVRFDEWKDYYGVKHRIASDIKPKIVAEIGVRAGYSAICFLESAPDIKFYGFDYYVHKWANGFNNDELHEHALELLKGYDCEIQKINTQETDDFGIKNVDLFHIDGDHSFKGAYHDLKTALPSLSKDGYILVDDIDYIKSVKKAADKFIVDYGLSYKYIKSLRGEYLIWK